MAMMNSRHFSASIDLHYHEPEEESRSSSELLLSKLQDFVLFVLAKIVSKEETSDPAMFENIEFIFRQIEKNCPSNSSSSGGVGFLRSFFPVHKHLQRLTCYTFIISQIYKMTKIRQFCTQRDLYYACVPIFPGKQRSVSQSIETLLHSYLGNTFSHHQLSVGGSGKSLVIGNLMFDFALVDDGGGKICSSDEVSTSSCSFQQHRIKTMDISAFDSSGGLILTPSLTAKIVPGSFRFTGGSSSFSSPHDQSNVFLPRFVLIIEKDAIFQKFVSARIHERFQCVMVTGKGYPCHAIRHFLHQLHSQWGPQVPMYGLMDCDPHGIQILFTYMFGAAKHQPKSKNGPRRPPGPISASTASRKRKRSPRGHTNLIESENEDGLTHHSKQENSNQVSSFAVHAIPTIEWLGLRPSVASSEDCSRSVHHYSSVCTGRESALSPHCIMKHWIRFNSTDVKKCHSLLHTLQQHLHGLQRNHHLDENVHSESLVLRHCWESKWKAEIEMMLQQQWKVELEAVFEDTNSIAAVLSELLTRL